MLVLLNFEDCLDLRVFLIDLFGACGREYMVCSIRIYANTSFTHIIWLPQASPDLPRSQAHYGGRIKNTPDSATLTLHAQ